jgi:hypothetical protein
MPAGDIDIKLLTEAADLIVKYGFLGVGLVLTFAIAPFVNKVWQSKNLTLTIACFGVAFIATWGVLDIVQRYFPNLISSKRVLLYGVVLKIPNGYQVQVGSDLRIAGSAYLKRENDVDNRELSNFPFLLLTSQSPNCLALGIINNNPKDDSGTSAFKIALMSEVDFKSDVALVAQVQPNEKQFKLKVWREVGGQTVGNAVLLEPLGDNDSGCAVGPSVGVLDWLMPTAFAQSPKSAQDFSVRLNSDDLVTRRNVRIELSKQGQPALDMTRQFLNSDNYRLQLGALVALSIMTVDDRKNCRRTCLQKCTNSPPTAMRRSAKRRAGSRSVVNLC